MHYFTQGTLLLLLTLFLSSCQTKGKSIAVESLSAEEIETYVAKGTAIAAATQKALGTQLKAAIKEGGVINALSYCNLAAIPLTDSIANLQGAKISRLSLQNRNPQNKANAQAGEVLIAYETLLLSGEKLNPVVTKKEDDSIQFYSPIMVGGLCLLCHGIVEETVADSTYAHIKKLYPNDLATNYSAGDLRGVWSVNFGKPE